MAVKKRSPFFDRVTSRATGKSEASAFRDIEDKHRKVSEAAEQWRTLLREMEHAGQSGDPRYDSYYQAYVRTRQQQKRLDLEIFNLRQGLGG